MSLSDDRLVRDRGKLSRLPTLARNYVVGMWRHVTLTAVAGSALVPTPARWLLLRAFGVKAQRCGIAPGVRIAGPGLTVGRYTFVNTECFFDTSAPITIGAECAIGMRVTFITSSHLVGPPTRRAGAVITDPIVVGDGVWIGAGATILPGVKIGNGAIIAAGSVVNRNCMANTLHAGIPARPVRQLDTGAGATVSGAGGVRRSDLP